MTYRILLLCSFAVMTVTPCLAQPPATGPASTAAPAPSNSSTPSAAASGNGSQSSPGQSSSSTASPAAAASSSAANASSEPSPDLVKKARAEGFKPEKQKNGDTMFCYKDASLGTRFESKKCVTADQVQVVIDARRDQRNDLSKLRTCTGNCGSQ
jgi:hypothetical protein